MVKRLSKTVLFFFVISLVPINSLGFSSPSFQSQSSVTTVVYDVYVDFVDTQFELAVREQLNQPSGEITESQLNSLTHLNIYNKDIQDFSDLVHAPNLINMTFVGGSMSGTQDIPILGQKIEELIIESTDIDNYQFISQLDNLKNLRLSKLSNIDFQSVAQNVYLETLQVTHNYDLIDISDIENMSGLRNLYFYETEVSDITPICSLIDLKELVVAKSKVENIDCLISLTNLEGLNISDNLISDISVISNLPNLRSVIASGNLINEIPIMDDIDNELQAIDLSSNRIKVITPLSSMPKLENIFLSNNEISEISTFETKSDMTNLSLNNNEISDISYLKADQNEDMIYLGLKQNRIDVPKFMNVITAFEENNTIVEYSDQKIKRSTVSHNSPKNEATFNNNEVSYRPVSIKSESDGVMFDQVTIIADIIEDVAKNQTVSSVIIDIQSLSDNVVIKMPQNLSNIFDSETGTVSILGKDVSYIIPASIIRANIELVIKRDKEDLYSFEIIDPANSIFSFDKSLITVEMKRKSISEQSRVFTVNDDGSIQYVPYVVDEKDGEFILSFKRNANSVYGVTEIDVHEEIDAPSWARYQINQIHRKTGVLGGFESSDISNREQFTHYLIKAFGLSSSTTEPPMFKDTIDSEFANEINVAYNLGLINGYSDSEFRPSANITREEAAMVIHNLIRIFSPQYRPNISEQEFLDSDDISVWARDSIYFLKDTGIVSGYNNLFRPKDNVSQAEMVVMIYNALRYFDMI